MHMATNGLASFGATPGSQKNGGCLTVKAMRSSGVSFSDLFPVCGSLGYVHSLAKLGLIRYTDYWHS
jgi:hypothetical protein